MRDVATKADIEAVLERVERRFALIWSGVITFVVLMVVALR